VTVKRTPVNENSINEIKFTLYLGLRLMHGNFRDVSAIVELLLNYYGPCTETKGTCTCCFPSRPTDILSRITMDVHECMCVHVTGVGVLLQRRVQKSSVSVSHMVG